jgi:hypothetical protein
MERPGSGLMLAGSSGDWFKATRIRVAFFGVFFFFFE